MTREHALAFFLLAGIRVDAVDELANGYWPRTPDYLELRESSPWWLVTTEYGAIVIGWRKRVIDIDWSRTALREIVTSDDVTKSETHVHAWNAHNALKYLCALKDHARKETPP